MDAVGTCVKCGQSVALLGTKKRVAARHNSMGRLCSGTGLAPRRDPGTSAWGATDQEAAVAASSPRTPKPEAGFGVKEKLITTFFLLGFAVWIVSTIVGNVHTDERVRQGVAAVCANYRDAVARDTGHVTTLAPNISYSADVDVTEFNKMVEDSCPDAVRAFNDEGSSSTHDPLANMSDCDRRIYAVTHSGVFTDEEENELIRGINATC